MGKEEQSLVVKGLKVGAAVAVVGGGVALFAFGPGLLGLAAGGFAARAVQTLAATGSGAIAKEILD